MKTPIRSSEVFLAICNILQIESDGITTLDVHLAPGELVSYKLNAIAMDRCGVVETTTCEDTTRTFEKL